MSDKEEVNGTDMTIKVPLDQWVHDIAILAAEEVIKRVQKDRFETCPYMGKEEQITKDHERVEALRLRFWILVALLATTGGALGSNIVPLIKLAL